MARMPKVVLVEDSPTQAMAIELYLQEYGVQVVRAGDGPDGIRAILDYQPDAVILDINLPTMNGYQVARRLKRHFLTSDIPLIMLTQRGHITDLTTGLDCGADYYIVKDNDAAEKLWKTLSSFGLISWE
ncbi:MAG: response regulator [Anaerolineae bacterium]|nr:response regulator [Anaerolineae bacterium]